MTGSRRWPPGTAAGRRDAPAARADGSRVPRTRCGACAPHCPTPRRDAVDDLANQAADEAMTALLGKLHTFEGRSRFSTWAFKFAILQAAVRGASARSGSTARSTLRDLEVAAPGATTGPTSAAEAARPAERGRPRHARRPDPAPAPRSPIALLVDGVPIDVLADRLGTHPRRSLQDPARRPGAPASRARRHRPPHHPTVLDIGRNAMSTTPTHPGPAAHPGSGRRAHPRHHAMALVRRLLRADGHLRRGGPARPGAAGPGDGSALARAPRLRRRRRTHCSTSSAGQAAG